mgnify:FL=1
MPMLIFEVTQRGDGQFQAECPSLALQTEGANLRELHDNILADLRRVLTPAEVPALGDIHLVFTRESRDGLSTVPA